MLREANQYSDRAELRGEELHAALYSLLKCFSHARDHAVSVNQTCRSLPPILWRKHAVWVCFSGADCPLARVLEELNPWCWSSSEAWTGQTEDGCWGPEPHEVSSGTCAYGTAPPVGPGTEVNRSAAGRGAPAGQ